MPLKHPEVLFPPFHNKDLYATSKCLDMTQPQLLLGLETNLDLKSLYYHDKALTCDIESGGKVLLKAPIIFHNVGDYKVSNLNIYLFQQNV